MNLDYQKLILKVIEIFFPDKKFNNIGKLKWHALTEKQKKRNIQKKGKELTKQRVQYSVDENFDSFNKSHLSDYRKLLISDVEEDGVFYCIYDYKTLGNMGQKTKYKFQIKNIQKSTIISYFNIELIEQRMIMIR